MEALEALSFASQSQAIFMLLLCHSHITRKYSYIIRIQPYIIRLSLVCYSYVTHMYSYVISMPFVCTLISFICHSYVTRTYLYVTRIYSYAILISLICSRMSLECVHFMSLVYFYHKPLVGHQTVVLITFVKSKSKSTYYSLFINSFLKQKDVTNLSHIKSSHDIHKINKATSP